MKAAVALLLALACLPAVAADDGASGRQLAADRGCYNCHGEPPRRNVPSFRQLVADYARLRGQAGAEDRLVQRLHEGSMFSHVAAHERLSEAEARTLVRWLVAGAP